MAMSAFVIMEQIAAANLGMMAIPRYAHPHFVVPAQLSKHHSKSALPTLAERSDRVFTPHLLRTSRPVTLKTE